MKRLEVDGQPVETQLPALCWGCMSRGYYMLRVEPPKGTIWVQYQAPGPTNGYKNYRLVVLCYVCDRLEAWAQSPLGLGRPGPIR